MYKLPYDLNKACEDMEDALQANINSNNLRFTIEFRFEGIKFNRIGLRIFNKLAKSNNVYLTYADPGAVALAQRDFNNIKDNIFTFKSFNDSKYISDVDSILISMLPQPYDFDTFEPMCENFKGKHFSLNPKFEDANIGIGNIIRERRKNFVKTWENIYFIQPLNQSALMHIFPNNWALFKEKDSKYFFVKDFENKPDNETIFMNL
tara:strand:+ start:1049 stop:1666 length:618 start_codon:yes stop_codon:yes gene_type:complete